MKKSKNTAEAVWKEKKKGAMRQKPSSKKNMNYPKVAVETGIRLSGIKKFWGLPEEKMKREKKRIHALYGFFPKFGFRSEVTIAKDTHAQCPYVVMTPKEGSYDQVVFYLHGGGYMLDITYLHWRFLLELCARSQSRIVIPLYPLTPEHTKDEIFPLVKKLYDQVDKKERDKDRILMGDSAGGGMALALAMNIRDQGMKTPRDVVLISPWLDVCSNTQEMQEISQRDPMLDAVGIQRAGRYYVGEGQDDWISSPIHGDLQGLGALTVFTGTKDVIHPNASALQRRCQEENIPLRYEEKQEQLHIFPLIPTKEGNEAKEKIVNIVCLGAAKESF